MEVFIKKLLFNRYYYFTFSLPKIAQQQLTGDMGKFTNFQFPQHAISQKLLCPRP